MAIISPAYTENKQLGQGYILNTEDNLMPRIQKAKDDGFGFETYRHLLWLFADAVIYKFQCEDFETSHFENTRKFMVAHIRNENKSTPRFFKSREMKLLRDDEFQFYEEFIFNLKRDTKSYYGKSAKSLVEDVLKECSFFEDKF